MDAYTRAYRQACRSLLAAGLPPAPCYPELQQLWAHSAEDRALVQQITEKWEIECPTM
jgi:hypothetical protein